MTDKERIKQIEEKFSAVWLEGNHLRIGNLTFTPENPSITTESRAFITCPNCQMDFSALEHKYCPCCESEVVIIGLFKPTEFTEEQLEIKRGQITKRNQALLEIDLPETPFVGIESERICGNCQSWPFTSIQRMTARCAITKTPQVGSHTCTAFEKRGE
jgi:hypothetical protein